MKNAQVMGIPNLTMEPRMKTTPLDPLVGSAFQTIRYLSQLAEALSLELHRSGSPDSVGQILKVVAHCADRAEHVAQEFVPGGVGEWHEKTDFIRRSLLDDVNWMLSAIEKHPARELLDNAHSAHPEREQLQALAMALEVTA